VHIDDAVNAYDLANEDAGDRQAATDRGKPLGKR
jgi:hypothetical protein